MPNTIHDIESTLKSVKEASDLMTSVVKTLTSDMRKVEAEITALYMTLDKIGTDAASTAQHPEQTLEAIRQSVSRSMGAPVGLQGQVLLGQFCELRETLKEVMTYLQAMRETRIQDSNSGWGIRIDMALRRGNAILSSTASIACRKE